MKSTIIFLLVGVLLCASGLSNEKLDSESGNILKFISEEIIKLGGKTNKLEKITIDGTWEVKRDELGVAINLKPGKYDAITNALSTEFGSPMTYIKANKYHGATYLYPWNKVGVSIYVKETTNCTEITLTKPIR